MPDELNNQISGNVAGSVIMGSHNSGSASGGGTINIVTEKGDAADIAKLLELLRQLHTEIEAAEGPEGARQAALGVVDQLRAGVDPEQPADAEPGRLQGLFSGLKALVQPLTVGTELLTQIGKLLGLAQGTA